MSNSSGSPAFDAAQRDPGKLVLHERDIAPLTVYEWEEDGEQRNAFGDQQVTVPHGAACIALQLYNFPTGQLRKIHFPKGTRTPWHPNFDDILLYSLDAHQVEFVGRQSFHARPGDATLHPAGVDHHSETLVAGTRLEFAFDAQQGSGRDLIALPGHDMALHEIAESIDAGRRVRIIGATHGSMQRYRAKLFHFPVYTMLEAQLPRGFRLEPHRNASERLLYVVSGMLQVTTDDVSDRLVAGSMARLVRERTFALEALANSVVLELDAFRAPRPYPRKN